MSEGELFILNEKVKAIAGVMLNLGVALLGGSAARIWLDGSLASATAFWLLGSAGLLASGIAVLEWLDSGKP